MKLNISIEKMYAYIHAVEFYKKQSKHINKQIHMYIHTGKIKHAHAYINPHTEYKNNTHSHIHTYRHTQTHKHTYTHTHTHT